MYLIAPIPSAPLPLRLEPGLPPELTRPGAPRHLAAGGDLQREPLAGGLRRALPGRPAAGGAEEVHAKAQRGQRGLRGHGRTWWCFKGFSWCLEGLSSVFMPFHAF